MIHFSLSRRGLIAVGAAAAAASARAQTKADQEFRYVSGHGGVPLNMVRTGNRNGPQILFLHGFAHSYLAFKRQLQSDLAREFDLVACDHRGHGNSGKP
ncbi:MAG: hypothetical protein SFV19_01375, partial [Rhodospirillaceae bacterium]|nr:hypothetical protein [Rhodospirillaceae bacterium]